MHDAIVRPGVRLRVGDIAFHRQLLAVHDLASDDAAVKWTQTLDGVRREGDELIEGQLHQILATFNVEGVQDRLEMSKKMCRNLYGHTVIRFSGYTLHTSQSQPSHSSRLHCLMSLL